MDEFHTRTGSLLALRGLEKLTPDQKDAITNYFVSEKFRKGENIKEENKKICQMYFLKEGKISVYGKEGLLTILEGHDPLLETISENPKLKLVALEPTICLSLFVDCFENIFGCSLRQKETENGLRDGIKGSSFLNRFSQVLIEKMIRRVELKEFKTGQEVIQESSYYEKIVFVCDGLARETKKEKLIPSGVIWKEKYLKRNLRVKKYSIS